MPIRPELKQFGDLRASDFDRYAVWVSVHSVDYNEEWYEETTEETFRPWQGVIPVSADEMYLVKTLNVLRDGSTFPGFATPAGKADDWGTIQPQIFLPSEERVGVWEGMFPAPDAAAIFCRKLERKKEEIFPLTFSASLGLTDAVCAGTIYGLMKFKKGSFELL